MRWDLLVICASAFAAVFVLLGMLALVMRALIFLFPEREGKIDAAFIAAVSAAASTVYAGSRVTKIEEVE